ncbi:MAG: hypothetical protein JWO82_962, partial [Akkermansiaceae bacterium]|nr:hypothetical protein [Akkermansiaceae bacterium]
MKESRQANSEKDALARTLFQMGAAYRRVGENAGAEASFDRACELYRQLAVDLPTLTLYRDSFAICAYSQAGVC